MHLIQTAFIYYAVFSMLEGAIGFNKRCPGSNEWHFRRKNCTSPDKPFYACLYNEFSLQYSENCTRKEYESRKGKKVVFSPAVSETDCTDSRFQPIKFTTRSFSDCIYAKSTCSEEGQVLAKNESSFVDRSCKCDYRKGYDYITQPKDKCSCVPSQEDCSCYLTNCIGHSALTPDYNCVLKIDSRSGSIVCGKILNGSPANVSATKNNTFVERKEYSSTSAITAFTNVSIFMLITVVSIFILWVLLNVKVIPHIMKTNGKSKKDWIILKSDDTPETYHVVEGDDFTIECEVRSLFSVKCVRWQINESYIMTEIDKYILNDSKLSLTIKNLSKDDTGTYKCIISNWFGLNNTSIDRCTNYLSALHRWMTCVHTLHKLEACRKEDENGITVTVHELPKEYKHEMKKKGEKVLMMPKIDYGKETMKSLPDDIKYVVWFYKTADFLRVVKLDQHGGINFGDINDEVVKQGPHGDRNDEVVKQGPHGDRNDEDVKQGLHGDRNDEVVKQGPHGDRNDGDVKQGPHSNRNEERFKPAQHSDINDGSLKLDKHSNINDEGTQEKHSLDFNTTVSHHGQYVCFIVTANGNIISNGWKLTVDLQGSLYNEVMKHGNDNSYEKTSTVEKAMKILENHGFVVIVGREGTGKSKISLQLASLCEQKDYLPFKVDQKSLDTLQIDDLKPIKVMFIIDNSVYNKKELDQMLYQLSEVFNISRTRILFTCRHLQPFIKTTLQTNNLYNDKALIKLDNILTVDDKRKILAVHMRVNDIVKSKDTYIMHKDDSKPIELSEDAVAEIYKTEPLLGFPLMASNFCSMPENFKKGQKYFTKPLKFLIDEIRDLYQSALKNEDLELMNQYIVLVYLATDEPVCFDKIARSASWFTQLNTMLYGDIRGVKYLAMSSIRDAADNFVSNSKYITKFDDQTYRFIHPCVSKAVFLSAADDLLNNFIQNGDVENIIEFVRSVEETDGEDYLVKELKGNGVHFLCERFAKQMTEDSNLAEKMGHYIYEHFIKVRDASFLRAIFNLDQFECFPSMQNKSPTQQDIEKESLNSKDDTQTVPNNKQGQMGDNHDNKNQNRSKIASAIKCYAPPQMIAMIEHLTRMGKDSWIYHQKTTKVPDVVVLYGLIVGCKNKFLSDVDQSETFKIILQMFTKDLMLKCCTPMDTFDNTFCHFLTLFNEFESCLILEKLIKCLNKKTDRKNILKVKNVFKQSPLQMAAYFGKARLFTYFWGESKKKKGKKEKLFEVVKNGMEVALVSLNFSNLNIDHDLRQSICFGNKNAYDIIMEALKK